MADQLRASEQDGTYPRPQAMRGAYLSLDGQAGFAHDDEGVGLAQHWERDEAPFTRQITLPFPPESEASGIGEAGFHPVVWYRIPVTAEQLTQAGLGAQGERVVLHLGAVDYRARVWVDGQLVATHEGGQTPFSADITEALADGDEHAIVVRAEEDPFDVRMPRGKQDWKEEPHAI